MRLCAFDPVGANFILTRVAGKGLQDDDSMAVRPQRLFWRTGCLAKVRHDDVDARGQRFSLTVTQVISQLISVRIAARLSQQRAFR